MSATKPELTDPPLLSGTPAVGETLSTTDGEWAGEPTSYSYEWYSGEALNDSAPIEGATDSSYTLTEADLGRWIHVLVSATNDAGTTTGMTALVGPVLAEGEEPEPEEEAAPGDIHVSVVSPLFTDGATVSAYVARGHGDLPPSGPPGKVVDTATASGSTVNFSGLAENTPYFAALEVDGAWRAVRFTTGNRSTATELITRDPTSGVLETRRGDQITVTGLGQGEIEELVEEAEGPEGKEGPEGPEGEQGEPGTSVIPGTGVLTGQVGPEGQIELGTGFEVFLIATGVYEILFTASSGTYFVIAASLIANRGEARTITVSGLSGAAPDVNFTVTTLDAEYEPAGNEFTFVIAETLPPS